jgi:hypothetical protein
VHCCADSDDSTFSREWGHFEKSSDGAWVRADAALALAAELAECRISRQREHDLRVTLAGELESFKIRYQDEVNARVNAENELDTVRSGFVAELRKAKTALAARTNSFSCTLTFREKRMSVMYVMPCPACGKPYQYWIGIFHHRCKRCSALSDATQDRGGEPDGRA